MGQRQSQPAAQPRTGGTLRRVSDVVQNTFKRSRLGSSAGADSATPMAAEKPALARPQPVHQRSEEPIHTAKTADPSYSSSVDEWESFKSASEHADPQRSADQGEEPSRAHSVRSSQSVHSVEDAQSVHDNTHSHDLPALSRLLAVAASFAAASLIGDNESPLGFLGFLEELLTAGAMPGNLLRTFSFPESNGQIPLVVVWVRERSFGDSWVIFVLGSSFPAGHPIFQSTDNENLEELLVSLGFMERKVSQEHLDAMGGLRMAAGTEDRCAICLQDCAEGDEVRALDCKHEYHRECIDNWVTKGHNSCPTCRQRVVSTDSEPLQPTDYWSRAPSAATVDADTASQDIDLGDVW